MLLGGHTQAAALGCGHAWCFGNACCAHGQATALLGVVCGLHAAGSVCMVGVSLWHTSIYGVAIGPFPRRHCCVMVVHFLLLLSWRTGEYFCIHSCIGLQQHPSRVRLCGPLGVLSAWRTACKHFGSTRNNGRVQLEECIVLQTACCLNQLSLHAIAPALQQLLLLPN